MKNYRVTVNGTVYDVMVEEVDQVSVPAAPIAAAVPEPPAQVVLQSSEPIAAASLSAGSVVVEAPMPGKILGIKVAPGQPVKSGDVLVVLEAMKMENEVVSPSDGIVAGLGIKEGATVETGDILVTLNS